MFSHASISSFRSLCLDKSQWNLLKALCKFQLVVNGRRDYGLTIFAYSLSAFQASSHIKRWPRGKPSGENSRPAPPPSFILIFTWCWWSCSNLHSSQKSSWPGQRSMIRILRWAAPLPLLGKQICWLSRHGSSSSYWARPACPFLTFSTQYVHILVKMMQIIFLRSHRFYESYRYFGPLCYNSNHK